MARKLSISDDLAGGIVRACGWCQPGDMALLRFPAAIRPALTVSHGICADCVAKHFGPAVLARLGGAEAVNARLTRCINPPV